MRQLFNVESSTNSGAVVITVTGEVDMTTAVHVAERMADARAQVPAPRAVIADLSGVSFLAAAGVAVLLAAHQACDERGTPLWIVAPQRAVRRPLTVCDPTSTLHVVAESPAISAARLTTELENRAAVDAAIGVLMSDGRVGEQRARAMLADQARRTKVSVLRQAHAIASRVPGRTADRSVGARSSLVVDLIAAAWETESAEHRANITDLASALAGRGHRVALHIRRTSADLPSSERTRTGFEVVRVLAGPPTTMSKAELLGHLDEFASVLGQSWGERAPDVVHAHSWLSGLAVRESTAPVVQSFHGLELGGASARAGASRLVELERLTALAAGHLIAASSDEVDELARTGVPRARMTSIPWGVDTGVFTPDGPVASRGAAPRVLALGEVSPHSGFDTAIKALAAVPDAELLIMGPIRSAVPRDDPEMARLVRLARERDVAHRLRFTGQLSRTSLPALLRSADIAVRVPTRDPSGTSAVQAMACGVPVIATAVGALTDVVIDDVTGVLVPPRDPAALGQALRDLLADPVRREICTITGVDRARTRYSWDRVAAEVVDAYRKAARTPQDNALAKRS